jgi:hypothetical protein
MTEVEWNTSTDFRAMLRQLGKRANGRKLRQFRCACCRRRWNQITDPRSRSAIETAERFAVGLVGTREVHQAAADAKCAYADVVAALRVGGSRASPACVAAWAAAGSCKGGVNQWLQGVSQLAQCDAHDVVVKTGRVGQSLWFSERDASWDSWCEYGCKVLRDLFGNPFRPVTLDPVYRTWSGGALVKLARAIYEEGRFADLPVLADALEDAGCTNTDVLTHCRSGSEHVRGCWVVDLLLGKQ